MLFQEIHIEGSDFLFRAPYIYYEADFEDWFLKSKQKKVFNVVKSFPHLNIYKKKHILIPEI